MTNSEIANELAKTVKTFCTPAQKLFFDRYTQPIILAILSDIDASLKQMHEQWGAADEKPATASR